MTRVDSTIPLNAALRALREDLDAQAPPAGLWADVQRALDGPVALAPRSARAPVAAPTWSQRLLGMDNGRGGPWAAPATWRRWGGAATCAALIGLSLLLVLRPPAEGPAPAQAPASDRPAMDLAATGYTPTRGGWTPAAHFVPLVSSERLSALAGAAQTQSPASAGRTAGAAPPAPAAAAWVLTTELPQQRLASFGLPYDPSRAAELMRAELLVSASGEVLAVRLLF